jgi:hypothetical protein
MGFYKWLKYMNIIITRSLIYRERELVMVIPIPPSPNTYIEKLVAAYLEEA